VGGRCRWKAPAAVAALYAKALSWPMLPVQGDERGGDVHRGGGTAPSLRGAGTTPPDISLRAALAQLGCVPGGPHPLGREGLPSPGHQLPGPPRAGLGARPDLAGGGTGPPSRSELGVRDLGLTGLLAMVAGPDMPGGHAGLDHRPWADLASLRGKGAASAVSAAGLSHPQPQRWPTHPKGGQDLEAAPEERRGATLRQFQSEGDYLMLQQLQELHSSLAALCIPQPASPNGGGGGGAAGYSQMHQQEDVVARVQALVPAASRLDEHLSRNRLLLEVIQEDIESLAGSAEDLIRARELKNLPRSQGQQGGPGGRYASAAPQRDEEQLLSHAHWRVHRMEVQLMAGARRMANQEKALRTIAATLEALVGPWFVTQLEKEQESVTGTRAWLQSTRSDQDLDEADKGNFFSLLRNGQMDSEGSREHPTSCSPCSFYCFSNRGCKKGRSCQFCHMLHISRANRSKKKKPAGSGE